MALYQKSRKIRSGSNYSNDEVFQLPQVPDMPIAGSSHGQKVTFRSPVVRLGSVLSIPYLVPQPMSFNVSQIPNSETFGKDTDSKAETRPRTPYQKMKRMREDASIASNSLQLVAEEFRKICEPKIQKLKGRYSANAMLVFQFMAEGYRDVCEGEEIVAYGSGPIGERLHLRRCKRCCRVLFRHQLYMEIP